MLRQAVADVLGCPRCKGPLEIGSEDTSLRCEKCDCVYPITDGIPVLVADDLSSQDDEIRFRDARAAEHLSNDARTLWDVVGIHHCVPLMRKKAEKFRDGFKAGEWLLDIGVGFGWHWRLPPSGVNIVGLDASLGNLRVAKQMIGEIEGLILVCADAAALPLRAQTVAGVWSVQVFQHFPREVLESVQVELDRVLTDDFMIEICNLNPALLHKGIYRLLGKRLHCRGRLGEMELNRFSAVEWETIWRGFRNHQRVTSGYSELFFHPDLRLRPGRYPMRLEDAISRRVPKLAGLFARQVQVRIDARGSK